MSTIQVRTDEKTKKAAKQVLETLGLDLSSAINVYLVQIIKHGGIPFAITNENGMTPAAEEQLLRDLASAKRRKKGYASASALHRAILGK
jgi:DNA-damage-inducible protein J